MILKVEVSDEARKSLKWWQKALWPVVYAAIKIDRKLWGDQNRSILHIPSPWAFLPKFFKARD